MKQKKQIYIVEKFAFALFVVKNNFVVKKYPAKFVSFVERWRSLKFQEKKLILLFYSL